MSAQANSVYFPPPPPSPSSPSYPHGQRRAQPPSQPPPITTDLSHRHGSRLNTLQTPASAHPGSPSTFSPAQGGQVLSPAGALRVSPSNMNAYNPQEWGRGGSVTGQYVPHASSSTHGRTRGSTREATGMEPHLPEPPPPYSSTASPNANSVHTPPHGAQFGQSVTASPLATTATNTGIHSHPTPASRSSALESATPISTTQPAAPIAFPPPPGTQRDRSASRTRGVLNNIAAFAASRTRSSDSASPANVGDLYARQRSESITRTPVRPLPNGIDQNAIPSAARRSASAGVVPGSHERSTSTAMSREGSSMSNDRSWEQGMPLPGPPPGPPPASSRSQSMNRVMDRSMNSSPDPSALIAPVPRRAARGPTLGPVPPTPADWVDEPVPQAAPQAVPSVPVRTPLRVDTQQHNTTEEPAQIPVSQSAVEPATTQQFDSVTRGGLSQSTRREPSLSIRDRRNEARARSRDPLTAIGPDSSSSWLAGPDEAKPADLVLPSSNAAGISRRKHVSKAAASPRGALSGSTPSSAEPQDSGALSHSSRPSPLDTKTVSGKPGGISAPTPPFSPMTEARDSAVQSSRSISSSMSTKTLPTPPGVDRGDLHSAPLRSGKDSATRSDASPYGFGPKSTPLHSAKSIESKMSAQPSNLDDFARGSLERFEKFLSNEMGASDDQERLELFAEFVVNESRLRRDRYSKAFVDMGSDVLDLTRDLWRSFSASKRGKATSTATTSTASQNRTTTPRPTSRDEAEPPTATSSTSSPGGAAFTPVSEPESPAGNLKHPQRQNSFQPMLSPIPSMAMSTVPDESDSRGRAPSRWWEQSDEGSFGAGGRKIERSKRESKYMGLPREAREHLQWETAEPSPAYGMGAAGPSNQYAYLGENEYPPEKVGWHEETTPSKTTGFMHTPSTPRSQGLDVSRLITLPPPFPRHHPAVNNNHPDLATTRSILRGLSDTEESASYFERYTSQYPESAPALSPEEISERRREMRLDIQNRVASGEMSFADAAKADSSFEESVVQNHRDVAQKNFDNFQKVVLKPLSAVLGERISKATSSIESLRQNLLRDTTPDQTQEEGDERPELLEKITLMKWLFEARESLYKELFELQNHSDEKYKHVILAPYRVTSNEAKIAEVQGFFARDSRDRILKFNTQAVKRFEAFLASVDEAVTRGVEAQLSAFWDIAPGLLGVVQKVPGEQERLHTFDVLIPPHELVENPPYADFPLQYLYTLLVHAEKSAYQFIESQTNLLCLLHEVKSGLMRAGCRLVEAQRSPDPNARLEGQTSAEVVARETELMRKEEDRRLTRELKEKVDVVEDQWRSALGSALRECKDRVGAFLNQVGGWDESLEE